MMTRSATTRRPHAPVQLSALSLVAGGVALAVSLTINPGPAIAHVHDATWASGHLLNGAAYLLILLGLPSLGAAGARWFGWTGSLGLGGLMVHFAVSGGSQLYYARISPVLAGLPSTHDQLGASGSLANVYGGWAEGFDVLAAIVLIALAIGLWHGGRSLRVPAALVFIAAAGELSITPVALVMYVIVSIWLGLRVVRTGELAAEPTPVA
jgi:hypothetical protein